MLGLFIELSLYLFCCKHNILADSLLICLNLQFIRKHSHILTSWDYSEHTDNTILSKPYKADDLVFIHVFGSPVLSDMQRNQHHAGLNTFVMLISAATFNFLPLQHCFLVGLLYWIFLCVPPFSLPPPLLLLDMAFFSFF